MACSWTWKPSLESWGHEIFCFAFDWTTIKMIGAEVLELGAILEHVVDRRKQ
jgi:hypothetical protein